MANNFYAQQDDLGFPIPGTMMSVKSSASIPKTSIAISAADTVNPGGKTQKVHAGGIRYFICKKANGDIIPNSLVLSIKQPAGLVYEFKVFY